MSEHSSDKYINRVGANSNGQVAISTSDQHSLASKRNRKGECETESILDSRNHWFGYNGDSNKVKLNNL